MPLTVLSDAARSHLKQERDRLVQERQAIIQSVVAAATVEVDQVLAHLEGLLNTGAIDASPAAAELQSGSMPSTASTRSTASQSPAPRKGARRDTKMPGKAAKPAASQSTAKAKAATSTVAQKAKATKASTKTQVKQSTPKAAPSLGQIESFDSTRLKAQFAGQTPQAVIMQVFQESPTQAFSQDDLINRMYDEFPPQDLIRARRSVSSTLMWSTRRGELVRVQEEPALYQLASKKG